MARTLTFKKIRFTNQFKRLKSNFQRDAENLPKREAAFTRRRARSIMKKAPRKPRTRFGNLQPYSKRSKRYGKYFWRKGQYSRPGHPPFHHGQVFNLRFIIFSKISASGANIPTASMRGGIGYAWRVGPKYKPSFHSTPIPQLHEYGGKLRLGRQAATFLGQAGNLRFRRKERRDKGGSITAHYPARPYMRPSAKEARESSARKSPHSLKKLVRLGGMRGKRTY